MKKLLFLITLIGSLCCGCISAKHDLNLTAAYPFEGRYDSSNKIEVNDKQIEFDSKDSVWLLSNRTLYNLLVDVSGTDGKVIFKESKIDIFNKKLLEQYNNDKKNGIDDFANEDFIWEDEKWELSDVEIEL